jgi:hypothetical protein
MTSTGTHPHAAVVSMEPSLRHALLIAFATPVVLTAMAWIWCLLAWKLLPDASQASEVVQSRTVLLASTLPGGTCTALSIISGLGGAAYLAIKRHGWLALVAVLFQVPVLGAIALAGVSFINFKPPNW